MSGALSTAGGGLPGWWKVCFVYGDQTKAYRKLYGRKSQVRSLKSYGGDLAAAAAGHAAGASGETALSDGDQDSM